MDEPINDYWQEAVWAFQALASRLNLPSDFIRNLLAVRQLMAPAYPSGNRAGTQVAEILSPANELPKTPAFAMYDWNLHHRLTILSGNPILP
jgi:GntR family negative regulator for fad regulon and positive regulator of fabA